MVRATRLTVATPSERITLPAPRTPPATGSLSLDFPLR